MDMRFARRRAIGGAHCAPAPAASTAGRSDSACSAAAGAGASRMPVRGLTSSALSVVQLRMTCMVAQKASHDAMMEFCDMAEETQTGYDLFTSVASIM